MPKSLPKNQGFRFLKLFALVHTSLPRKNSAFSFFKAFRARPHESAKEKFKGFRFFNEKHEFWSFLCEILQK